MPQLPLQTLSLDHIFTYFMLSQSWSLLSAPLKSVRKKECLLKLTYSNIFALTGKNTNHLLNCWHQKKF